jgi:predicted TIM-barrel fold metal-dependent hydrolase
MSLPGRALGMSRSRISGGRIDMHAHPIFPEYRAAMLEDGRFSNGGYPTPTWSPERALGFMDRYGIGTQVLSVADPGTYFLPAAESRAMARHLNEQIAGHVRKHPMRFGGLAVLPMPDVQASIAELDYALNKLKLDGVALLTNYEGVLIGDPRYDALFAALHRHKAYVFLHPAEIPDDDKPDTGLPDFMVEFPFDTTRALTSLLLAGTFKRYPNVRMQFAHAGGTFPFLSYRILGGLRQFARKKDLLPASVRQQLFYDTALNQNGFAMESVLRVSDVEHVVFGSDFPFSELLFVKAGDPAPDLSKYFNGADRAKVERANVLRQLPRLAARLS